MIEAFLATEMGEGCEISAPRDVAARFPMLRPSQSPAALWSPHDLRVESREAIPRLAAWLAAEHG